MAKYKVRHGLVSFTVNDRTETAFRGQIVDIPDSGEAERLLAAGALVTTDTELVRAGAPLALPESPTDAEIVAWVTSATPEEVRALAATRPILAERLRASQQQVKAQYDYQNEVLGRAIKAADEGVEAAGDAAPAPVTDRTALTNVATQTTESDPPGGGDGGDGGNTGGGDGSGGSSGDGEPSADTIVAGSVEDVTNYLSEHPERASEILDAETAARGDKGPRSGVVKAVEAAAGHTS